MLCWKKYKLKPDTHKKLRAYKFCKYYPCPSVYLKRLNHAQQQGGCIQLSDIENSPTVSQDVREETITGAFKEHLKIKPRAMTCHVKV